MSLALEAFITPRGAPRIPERRERYVFVQADLRHMPVQVDPKEYERMIGDLDKRRKRWHEERGNYADLARLVPTVAIHVFHETGQFDGKDKQVLKDQASFGFFVNPPRKVIPRGWGLAIDGAVEVAPNLYKMRVSDIGTAIVRVRLKALTDKDPKFDRGDPAWRSKAHKDTRCEKLDERECEQPGGKQLLSLSSELDQAAGYGDADGFDDLENIDDAGAPEASGCQSVPAAGGSAVSLLLLGLALLGWYALRRRARG